MAKQCVICGKKSVMSRQRKKLMSKYNPTPKKRRYPNLQSLSVPKGISDLKYKDHAGQKITACTKCIKAFNKKD